MEINKRDIVDINIETGNIHRSFLNHSIGSADNAADQFGVRVFRNGEAVDLSGCSCYGFFKNSQGTNIALTSYGTVNGNMAYVTLPQACYDYEGQFCLAIKLIGGGVTGTMRIIDGTVDNTNTGGAVAPTGTVPTYVEILEVYDEMVAALEVANNAIAQEFAQAEANPARSYVINENALYYLPDGHEAGDTWADTTKVATNFGKEAGRINNNVHHNRILFLDQFDQSNTSATYTKTEGKGWINNGQTLYNNSSWTAFEITDIDDEKEYRIYGINIGSQATYAVYQLNANGDTIRSMMLDDLEIIDSYEFIVIPEDGCATIRYTTYKNSVWDKAPQEVSYEYKNYNELDLRIRENTGSNRIDNSRFISQFDRVYTTVSSYTKVEGKGWINNGQTLYDNSSWTAFEITGVDKTKEYMLYGVNVGSSGTYAVYQLDADGNTITSFLTGDMETISAQEHIVVPMDGCATIRYTTYKNSTWDKAPDVVEYRQKEDVILPSYYYANGYWDGIINSIKEETAKILNGCAFVFVTDLHMYHNRKNSIYMIKDIMKKTTVPFVICGGDIPTAFASEAGAKQAGDELVKWQKMIGPEKFFTLRGNHDFTGKTNPSYVTQDPDTGFTFPVSYTYNYIARSQEKYVVSSDTENMAWYIDIPAQKTRIVGINSCDGQIDDETASWGVYEIITQSQVDWILEKALDADGYRYIFMSHIASDPDLGGYSSGQDVIQAIIEALKNHSLLNYSDQRLTAVADFTESNSTVICHICGHNHTDGSHVKNNVLSILSTCDALYVDDGYNGTAGTVTEQAFDIFCIDYDTGKIKAIRAGRGADRNWTYGS